MYKGVLLAYDGSVEGRTALREGALLARQGRQKMKRVCKMAMVATGTLVGASTTWADTLPTHRIPAVLAVEAASETIAACARQGYHETAVVLDADGATIVALRGDDAGIHTLDSAHDKAYTSVSFKNDTLALASGRKAKTRLRRSPSCRMSCSLVAA